MPDEREMNTYSTQFQLSLNLWDRSVIPSQWLSGKMWFSWAGDPETHGDHQQ